MSYATKPYFKDVLDLGDLYLKYMLLYYDGPQVFICRDLKGNLYYCSLAEIITEQRWLVAPTSVDRIKAMFKKEITVRDMLAGAGGTGIIITYKGALEIQRSIPCSEFPEDDLPTAGYYWESEEQDLAYCLDVLVE